jgi:hypothetical protein
LPPIDLLAAFLCRIDGLAATLDDVIDRICANTPYVLCSFFGSPGVRLNHILTIQLG